jgi:hypothetical protein
MFLGVLARLYLNDMALKANILLLILLEYHTLTNTVAHYLLYKKLYILHKAHSVKRNTKQMKHMHIF